MLIPRVWLFSSSSKWGIESVSESFYIYLSYIRGDCSCQRDDLIYRGGLRKVISASPVVFHISVFMFVSIIVDRVFCIDRVAWSSIFNRILNLSANKKHTRVKNTVWTLTASAFRVHFNDAIRHFWQSLSVNSREQHLNDVNDASEPVRRSVPGHNKNLYWDAASGRFEKRSWRAHYLLQKRMMIIGTYMYFTLCPTWSTRAERTPVRFLASVAVGFWERLHSGPKYPIVFRSLTLQRSFFILL